MANVGRWLEGSRLAGWLLWPNDWWSGSVIISMVMQLGSSWLLFMKQLLRGSFFLSWLVGGSPGSPMTLPASDSLGDWGFVNSKASSLWKLLEKGLWFLGDWLRPLLSGSNLLTKPAVLTGLVIALGLGADLAQHPTRGWELAIKLGLIALGLLMAVRGPDLSWWYASTAGQVMSWWNGRRSGEQKPRASMEYSLFLVAAYVVVDYLLRTYSPFPFLTGLWDELLFLVMASIWLVRTGLQKLSPQGTRFLLPFILYLAVYCFLFLINSPEQAAAVEGLRVYLQYVLWFFLGANLLFSKSQFKWLCDIFLLVAFLLALHGIYQYYIGIAIPTTWTDSKVETSITTRVYSIIGSPNVLGGLLVLSIPMALASLLSNRSYLKKAVYGAVLVCMLACMVFTFSRGAWLALGLTAILMGLWLDRRILWGLLVIAILTPILMPSVSDRLTYMTTSDYMASSERGGRIGRWTQTLATWETSPALGVGLGRFGGAVAARFYPNDSFYADNFYLKTGAEAGWLGLLAFLFLVVSGLRLARSRLDQVDDLPTLALGLGVLAGLVGILAHNGVENIFEVPMMATYFWFFLGLLAAIPGKDRDLA